LFLKRLDLVGFKSFADKTSIEFSSGITAVVGPNGSGKSNISDAIRWVLGEQSAKNLRGAKMEDVIFAGSERRRSINYCEVSLTLDNADGYLPVVFDEVTITRRVYRSGESEYRINKQQCRLKDITELFMDSGLGRESYSIIGQGRIEEILSTRPEDRRSAFEDAAGIVKFKFRKREAERKLDETADNIVRVDDILAELASQAGPLQKASEKECQYKEIQDELTGLEISVLISDIQQLQQRWEQAQADIEEWESRRAAANQSLADCEAAAQEARGQLENQSRALDSLQQDLMTSVQERQRYQGQMELLQERVAHAQRAIEEHVRQLDSANGEFAELNQQVEAERQRLQTLEAELEVKSIDLEAAVAEVNPEARAALEAEINQLNNELIELHHSAATARNELKQARETMADGERRRQRLNEELQQRENAVLLLEQQAQQLAEEQDSITGQLAEAMARLNETTLQAREVTAQENSAAAAISQLESTLARLESKRDLLQDLEAGYDGYAQGVRFVLHAAQKERLQGIHGSVASLIRVPPTYEVAIETALGGAVQNVVSSDEASARAAIALLKQRQAGRATFMPLDVIRSRRLSSSELKLVAAQPGFVSVAGDLVESDHRYREIVEHLLGSVIVAADLKAANELARILHYRVRIVTLDGDVVNPGGTMSGGGQTRKGPGLLGRSRELRQVEQELGDTVAQLQQQKDRQQQLRRQLLQLQSLLKSLEGQIAEGRAANGELNVKLKEVKTQQQNAQELCQSIRWEKDQLQSGDAQWQQRLQRMTEELAKLDSDLETVESQLRRRRTELAERDQHVASYQEHLTGLRVEVATLRQERDVINDRVVDFRRRMQRLRSRIAELETEMSQLRDSISSTQQEIERLQNQSHEIATTVATVEADIAQRKQERLETEAQVQAANARARQEQQAVHSVEEQIHRAQVQSERVDVELHHALTRMGEDYKMTYEWANRHFAPAGDVDEVRKRAGALRSHMESLGDIQFGAMEEWARLSERMSFLTAERDDLDAARVQLQGLIEDIETEMSKRFAETFQRIRQEFEVVFRQLFDGGKADLQLTHPEDMLTTGIEVVVQPPGKKLQNLNLLSGGERVLIAMALLFAILRVRPVPFCVLDEVEAALDDANVTRFAQYLRKFSDDSQFIAITHRRGTMEEADVLYGVTMQESGVSSLIGVKLSDVEVDSQSA